MLKQQQYVNNLDFYMSIVYYFNVIFTILLIQIYLLMNSMFTRIVRLALGLALLVFGANMIKSFLPLPPPTGAAGDFMNSLGATGYIFPVVGVLEVLIGGLLLMKKWVAFALILLAPISINILLFHLFLDIPGLSMAIVVVVFNTILIFKHWQQYKPLFY